MKTIKAAILLFIFSLVLFSCSKDEAKPEAIVYPDENPMAGFLVASGFNFSKATYANPGGVIEDGFGFKPKVNGKIKALVVKLHVPNSNLRVTIWDRATGQAIATNYMNIPNSGVEVTTAINPVQLQKDKEYVFSIKSQFFYTYQKANLAIGTYPVDSGNISITGSFVANDQIPSFSVSSNFDGDYSFIFQQTE